MDRCAKCIMPSTAEGIVFDEKGLCPLCRKYTAYVPRGEEALRREIEPYLPAKGDYNCIVPISGGRDSTYALYYAVRVLGLSPLAVHNDNDFETETATRNLERTSKRLNVPLIRVSSPKHLTKKIVAEKFKMNASFGARLVVDQTCEACQIGFESAAYNIARKNGIRVVLWADSKDESTKAYHELVMHPNPSTLRRFLSPHAFHLFTYKYYCYRLGLEYGPHSPRGLNEVHLYDYIRWDQNVIVDTIQRELDWSVPENSPTTWRVDCSLVPLINYLTEKAYGVSKIELGFSNMVRGGKMDRDDALRRVALIKQSTDIAKLKGLLSDMGLTKATVERIIQ